MDSDNTISIDAINLCKTVTKESDMKQEVKEYLESQGWLIIPNNQFKQRGYGIKKGVSDLTILRDGRTIWVELKMPGKKQNPDQVKFQRDVESRKGEYMLIYSLEECRDQVF